MRPEETLSQLRYINCDVWFTCGSAHCWHAVFKTYDELIASYGETYETHRLKARMKCTRCGHVGATMSLQYRQGPGTGWGRLGG